ncbi:MAG TPA: ATP-dependent Clp protease ATP-binding subunit [Planktothrix sp.]|jgi:ATP-dependent Clp protease ATP-binding subunit ClpC
MFDIDQQTVQALSHAALMQQSQKVGYIGTVAMTAGILFVGDSIAAQLLEFHRVRIGTLEHHIVSSRIKPGKFYDFQLPSMGKAKMSESLVEALGKAKQKLGNAKVGVDALLYTLLQTDQEVRQALRLGSAEIDFMIDELNRRALGGPAASEIPDDSGCASGSCSSLSDNHKSKTPNLDRFTVDLTALARANKLMPVIGRSKEIMRCMQILGRKTKNNPVLIGEPGVGKTAIVEGLAQLVATGDVPRHLRKKRILMLDVVSMLAGCSAQGAFEARIKGVIAEYQAVGDAKIFVDELHILLGAGDSGGGINAATVLKPALARGEFSMIGATTRAEYRRLIENVDEAFARRVISVVVEPPSTDDTIAILSGLKGSYEEHHQVIFSDEAIRQAALLSDRYINHRYLPDKAIDLIDEAGSRLVMKLDAEAARIAKEQSKNEEVKLSTDSSASELIDPKSKPRQEWTAVTGEDIEELVHEMTGIPLGSLKPEDLERYRGLEKRLHQRVVGQHPAVVAVARAIRRARVGLSDPNRPCVFLFLGPTGVGKTEVARALQEFLSGQEKDMVRLDMSEFMERHAVATLVGAPPGYVGYYEGGRLTEAVRKRPYSVVLLDEIEKAHPDVYNVLLQIFEDGRLTDRSAQGQTVDFKNTIIIMTSNLGAHLLRLLRSDNRDEIIEQVMRQVKGHFSPEFLNRLDDTICFNELSMEEIGQILGLLTDRVNDRLSERKIGFTLDESAKALVLGEGYDQEYGARPLRRAVQKHVEDVITDGIIDGNVANESTLLLTRKGDTLAVAERQKLLSD